MIQHSDAIRRFVAQESGDARNLAGIVTGSVARGTERPDSDIDLYLVVTDDAFAEALAARRIMYTSTEGITFDGGYFDVKITSIAHLDAAASRGDDAMRASFDRSVIAWTRVDDLGERIERIVTPPDSLWHSHEASFIAQARLHGGYFLPGAARARDGFLLASSAVHLATAACRAMLARHRVLFQGPKYLRAALADLDALPAGFIDAVDSLLRAPNEAAGALVLRLLEEVGDWPVSHDETLSRFFEDNELAWFHGRLPPEYR